MAQNDIYTNGNPFEFKWIKVLEIRDGFSDGVPEEFIQFAECSVKGRLLRTLFWLLPRKKYILTYREFESMYPIKFGDKLFKEEIH